MTSCTTCFFIEIAAKEMCIVTLIDANLQLKMRTHRHRSWLLLFYVLDPTYPWFLFYTRGHA